MSVGSKCPSEREAAWNFCEQHFKAALAYEHRPITLQSVRAAYMAGEYEILKGAQSALLVTVLRIGGFRHLHAYLGGGELSEMVDILFPRAELIGQRANCESVLIDGRPGWARALRHRGYGVVSKNPGWWLIAKKLQPKTYMEHVKPLTTINYTLNPMFAAVATDTLVTHVGDWAPLSFTPKAAFIPHLDALITASTSMPLLTNAFNYALTAPVQDIADLAPALARVCKQTAREVMAFYPTVSPVDEDFRWAMTCTVSLFGWSRKHGRLIGLRFGRVNDFEPELLADGVYTHPPMRDCPETITADNVLELCDITVQQQERAMAKASPAEPCATGGDLLLWEMSAEPGGHVVSRVQRVHRFDTYASDLGMIRQRAETGLAA